MRPGSPVSSPAAWTQIDRSVFLLRELILKGEFKPGERISELPLSARLKVSRTPLRLALDRLAGEGLVEPYPTGGFIVREFSQADIWDAIDLRGVLEGTAARLAAERHGGEADLAALSELCDRLETLVPVTPENFATYLAVNAEFHEELKRLAGSRILAQALDRIYGLPFAAPAALVFGGIETAQSPQVSIIAQEHHRAIVEAITYREGARAEALAREHSRVARKNLSRALADSQLISRVPGAALISRNAEAPKGRRKSRSRNTPQESPC